MAADSPALPARRAAAFGIDLAIIAAVGLALMHGAFTPLALIGAAGPVVGALAVFGYFLPTAQPLSGRRTPGQWALGLAQVPATDPWSPRYRVYLAPLLLVLPLWIARLWDVRDMADLAAEPWRWAAITLGISVTLANALLVAFPDGEGRLLHERLAGTIVVTARGAATASPHADRLAPWHWGAIACLPAAVLAGLALFVPRPADLAAIDRDGWQEEGSPHDFGGVERLEVRIHEDPAAPGATVAEVRATVRLESDFLDAQAASIARVLAARRHALGERLREMHVQFVREADLGLLWRSEIKTVTVTPAQWRVAALPTPPRTGPTPTLDALTPDSSLVTPPPRDAPRAGASPAERAQGAASLQLARPMLAALKAHWAAHGAPPQADALASNPAFRVIEQRGIHIETGPAGSLEVRFVSGPLAPLAYSWIPIRQGRGVDWTCAHPSIPAADLGEDCR